MTKLWNTQWEDVQGSIKESLSKLRLDYVDLYLVHWPIGPHDIPNRKIAKIPIHKVWADMEALVDLKLAKSIGVSNFPSVVLLDMATYARIYPAINEIEYHPYCVRAELKKVCDYLGVTIIAYNSLTKGYYSEERKSNDWNLLGEDVVLKLAEKYKKSPGQIALNWAISQGIVVIPLTTHSNRLSENLDSINFRLEKEDIEKISLLNKDMRFCRSNFQDLIGDLDIQS